MFASHQLAREAKWFSRRHQTSAAHEAEQARRRQRIANKHGRVHAPITSVADAKAQIATLDARLGYSWGALKERARLKKIIGENK